MSSSVDLIAQHILKHFAARKLTSKPLFVAVQGPQGSGKSYLTNLTHKLLSSPPHCLRVVVVSIDDLYLSHSGLVELSSRNSHNPLWRGRGQPGTHDIELAKRVLEALKAEDSREVEIPIFDKSLFNGEGDRLPVGHSTRTPVDIVIMEGWCTGFYPISPLELDERWNGAWEKEKQALGLSDSIIGSKECLETINTTLHAYLELWSFFDVFVQVCPPTTIIECIPTVVHHSSSNQFHALIFRLHTLSSINGGSSRNIT